MPIKPFRTPWIRHEKVIDHTSEPAPKKRRISEDVEVAEFKVPLQPAFKPPQISSIPRNPFATIKNPATPRDVVQPHVGAIEHGFDCRRYNVLWYVCPWWI